jgi:hypothetical protein
MLSEVLCKVRTGDGSVRSNVDHNQINIPRDTQVQDTMVEMSSSIKQKGYARAEHYRPLV